MSVHLNYEWELEMQFNPKEVEEPYELYFFLGSVPSSPSDWRSSPSRLFEPITSHARTTTTEYRFLNNYLKERSKSKLEDDGVIPYLRENLSWRVKKRHHDEKIENSKLESLKVFVHGPDGKTTLDDKAFRE
jgi:hypothetical protein